MNKAFVREPEDHGDRCPACGTTGSNVYEITLRAHLSKVICDQFVDSVFFCPHPTCTVAYFDRFERTIPVDDLLAPVYPKDPNAPICPCFNLTCEEIQADVDEGVVTRVKAHLERAQSDEARCATQTPDGKSCIPAVQQCFMRLRSG